MKIKDKNRAELVKAIITQNKGRIFTVVAKRKTPKVKYFHLAYFSQEREEVTKTRAKELERQGASIEIVTEKFMKMTCRTGVTKHLKGGESTIRHCEDLISVNVVPSQRKNEKDSGYRCFSAYNVLELKAGGTEIKFKEEDVLSYE
ncbi:hypothetical protein HOR87_gp19 [Marinomonas phage CB5A]|uniref:Uncharacterized protein n=1 Tax=Marinomonas phage CB5A TaxID=2022859 RepID=A0A222G2Z4_9CAUD|nr:hypothetical protein HOR87_gp19 [Marinomonas phage CB5A]ASP46297.1 hypothetical protein [Marinomonas phage CB5A]